jgi:hypothetical protein
VDSLITSGRLVEGIAVLVIVEFIGLALLRHRTGRGPSTVGLLGNLGAGLCLLMALRSALVAAGWQPIALWLTGALVAHAVDILSRMRR